MGLGFNLCVAPPRDHSVPILEGEGMGHRNGVWGYGGTEMQGAGVNLELMELCGQNYQGIT